LLEKWYEAAYFYDFQTLSFKNPGINYGPLAVILYDTTEKVGCYKACCSEGEVVICDFWPRFKTPTLDEFRMHVKSNRFLDK
jgi:hypothetical protein